MTKQEILTQALNGRIEEVLSYQINIDNYKLAINKIALEHCTDSQIDLAMQSFATQLADQLTASIIEQRKAQIILDVIAIQLEEDYVC